VHLFISDLNQSPFNVGTQLALDDFTLEQVADLNERYGARLRGPAEIARFYRLVGGHPHLVRLGLHEMATRGAGIETLEALAERGDGSFGAHLRHLLARLTRDPEVCEAMRAVLRAQPCPTEESFFRLRSAGVLIGDTVRQARPRCGLYTTFLKRHLL
jgi:hypothetical protein